MVNFLGITSSIASEWTNFRQGYKLDGALEVRLESIEYQEAIRSVTENTGGMLTRFGCAME
jgi:hypothetical protein